MKKLSIKLIVLLTAISLISLIAMQLYWIKNAFEIEKSQYDHRVTLALREVLTDMVQHNNSCEIKNDFIHCVASDLNDFQTVVEVIDTLVLDSLLTIHFDYQQLDNQFEYAIRKWDNDSLMFEKSGILSERISIKTHRTGLQCLWKTENYYLEVYFPEKQQFILLQMSFWLGASLLFLLIIIFSFTFIVHNMIRQKKLSEIKNDFINNMTHELKTPIATISLASEVLLKQMNANTDKRTKHYTRIINQENEHLRQLVEQVLQTAILEKEGLYLNKTAVDVHQLLRDSVKNSCFEQCEKPVSVKFELKAKQHILQLDKIHFTNIINNLLDNAYKYSEAKSEIFILTENSSDKIHIVLKDNGIGMNLEMQKQIFDKFYRVPTGDVHNVKGFGLGLYYVKNMVEAHGGIIQVKSELNLGSEFKISIPLSLPQ